MRMNNLHRSLLPVTKLAEVERCETTKESAEHRLVEQPLCLNCHRTSCSTSIHAAMPISGNLVDSPRGEIKNPKFHIQRKSEANAEHFLRNTPDLESWLKQVCERLLPGGQGAVEVKYVEKRGRNKFVDRNRVQVSRRPRSRWKVER